MVEKGYGVSFWNSPHNFIFLACGVRRISNHILLARGFITSDTREARTILLSKSLSLFFFFWRMLSRNLGTEITHGVIG